MALAPGKGVAVVDIRIDHLLETKGRTAYWLALETGITHSTIYKLRHGKVKALRLDVIEAICKALDCQPGDLLTLPENRIKRKPRPKAKR